MANKSIGQLITDFRRAKGEMEKTANNLPRIIGHEIVDVVQDNFRIGGYDSGQGIQRWPQRLSSTNRRYDKRTGVKGSVFNSGNKTLLQTGNLRDSVKYSAVGSKMIKIGVDTNVIPYAAIHNEGKRGLAWGKNPFRMPMRKFMPTATEGANPKMLARIKRKLDYEVRKAMNIFRK